MKRPDLRYILLVFFVLLAAAFGANTVAQNNPAPAGRNTKLPIWAYPVPFPPDGGKRDNTVKRHLPGSKAAYTDSYLGDLFSVADWYPDAHPAMPSVVSQGRKPQVFACGYCHLPNGQGRPENESLAGLPAAYIVQQMADFKNGLRKSSEPTMLSVNNMVKIGKAASDDEVRAAAAYFSSIKLKPWIRVVETTTVPKTRALGGMMLPVAGGGMEPLGNRIIETPEDVKRMELRDPTAGFVAYVPVGSIQKGKDLVTTGGGGKTMQCTICHGQDLKGLADVPSLAGRSPDQIVRQIIDMQNGNRNGPKAALMKPVVAKLSLDDTIDIAAYLSSLQP